MRPSFRRGRLYSPRRLARAGRNAVIPMPLGYPLDQMLLMHLLTARDGLIFHSTCAVIDGKGYLFVGRSGAGKSTMAAYLRKNVHATILSDDRTVVRRTRAGIQAFGTPWPGSEGAATNQSAPLSKIVVLKRGRRNRLQVLRRDQALAALLPIASIPWYDARQVREVLKLLDRLLGGMPALSLGFNPHLPAATWVQRMLRDEAKP